MTCVEDTDMDLLRSPTFWCFLSGAVRVSGAEDHGEEPESQTEEYTEENVQQC